MIAGEPALLLSSDRRRAIQNVEFEPVRLRDEGE